MLITEHELAGFRDRHLNPAALLDQIERHVQVLHRVAMGVGKSVSADALIRDPETHRRFDLVIYVAPAWNILNEREIVAGRTESPVPWLLLRPRPTEQCGPYAEEWERLERQSCAAYGKATLCRPCQLRREDECFWPEQLRHIEEIRLVFCTEQQFVINRSLLYLLKFRTGSQRPLVILDEAKLLDTSFEMRITPRELDQFATVLHDLARPKGLPRAAAEAWCGAITDIAGANSTELSALRPELPRVVHKLGYKTQKRGIDEFGEDFRYIGYDLAAFPYSRPEERWKKEDGTVCFTVRPYLHCHLLILSAHLHADYVAHRLGLTHIASPFARTRFSHSESRVLNLRSRIGADRYLAKNAKQILDTFAVLVARNILDGRTTLLVSRKKSKQFCADQIKARLARWGLRAEFVTEDYDVLPSQPDPCIVPIIHYGILGVNNFSDYQSAYCVNSYYVSDRELNRAVQDADPEEFRVKLKITSGGTRMERRVMLEKPTRSQGYLARLADTYLRRLEIDPVIQAVGRVRFATRPREVVLFQMSSLADEVGACQEVATLAALRQTLEIPSASALDEWVETKRLSALRAAGHTVEDAGRLLGLSRSTAHRRLKDAECVKTPSNISLRVFDTLPALTAAEVGGVA